MNTPVPLGSTIVLCGGPLNPANVLIGHGGSNAMVPINGKPVIGWVFDDLIAKGLDSATLVIRRENQRVLNFLERAYGSRITVSPAFVESNGSILDSLAAGMARSPGDGPVRLVLGDTLIRDAFDRDDDFIYAGEVEDSLRWCVVETDAEGKAVHYTDKQELPGSKHLAVAGYYRFADRGGLERSLAAAIAAGERELSAALRRYGETQPVVVHRAREWYDFGHIDNYVRAKRDLLQSRFFNTLKVDPFLNTITKVSTDNAKLEDELAWYLGLPQELQVLTPRIVSSRRENGSLEIVQEYYGYPTLAELFVYSQLPIESWRVILRHVLRVHDEFRRRPGRLDRAAMIDMYVGKTARRLKSLAEGDALWKTRLDAESAVCNGTSLRNVGELWPAIEIAAARLADTAKPGIVHGDLCFSNILFDYNNQIIRLVDPRGRFGERTIFGDPRYDLAKLRHSAHGLYDFIVADMFQIAEADGGTVASVADAEATNPVAALFDRLVADAGHDVREIQLIEGLLFLSMLPLHAGTPRRQQMMYLTGLQLLNEVV